MILIELRKCVISCAVGWCVISAQVEIATAQLSSITIDAKNSYSTSNTQMSNGALNLQSYGQNYMLSVNGYGYSPRLLQIGLQTNLNDFSTTTRSLAQAQTVKNRNLGYYNLSATMFSGSGYPLTFIASRNSSKQQSRSLLTSPSSIGGSSTNDIEILGLRWNIPKNDILPNVEVILERNQSKDLGTETPTKRLNETAGIRVSNSSADYSSQYTIQYTGTRFRDERFSIDRVDHDLQFNSMSKLSKVMNISTNGVYKRRDDSIIWNGTINTRYIQNRKISHSIKFDGKENLFLLNAMNKSSVKSVSDQTDIKFSDKLRGNLGGSYLVQDIVRSNRSSTIRRGMGEARLVHNNRVSAYDVTVGAGMNVGFEGLSRQERKLVRQSRVNLGATSFRYRRVKLKVREELSLDKSYGLSEVLRNNFQINIRTNLIPGNVIGIDFSQRNAKYLDETPLPSRSTTTIGGSIGRNITQTSQLQVQHSTSWMESSFYSEIRKRTAVSFADVGTIRNMIFQIRAERTHNTYSDIKVINIEASAGYRFYAYLCNAKYNMRSIAGIQNNELMIEVSRQLALNFN